MSNLTLGMMYFGSETSEEEAFMEAGCNLIDTANVYVGGVTEEIIGRWLTSRPRGTFPGGIAHDMEWRQTDDQCER